MGKSLFLQKNEENFRFCSKNKNKKIYHHNFREKKCSDSFYRVDDAEKEYRFSDLGRPL